MSYNLGWDTEGRVQVTWPWAVQLDILCYLEDRFLRVTDGRGTGCGEAEILRFREFIMGTLKFRDETTLDQQQLLPLGHHLSLFIITACQCMDI